MGSTHWDGAAYASANVARAASGASAFEYTDRVLASQPADQRAVHPTLLPKGISVRESRDSEVHPESLAIIVGFDVTGSMHGVPRQLQQCLPALMDTLIVNGVVPHPQVLISAFTDCYSTNKAYLQVGQFEAGNEIENDLGNLWLEGGGGGSAEESSEMLLWFAAHRTSIDCFEKRGQKGFLFIITDEKAYARLPQETLEQVFGAGQDTQTCTLEETLAAAQDKYHVFCIMPKGTSYWGDPGVRQFWQSRLGSNYLRLEEPEEICQAIVATIGITTGALTPDTLHLVSDAAACVARLRALTAGLVASAAAVPGLSA